VVATLAIFLLSSTPTTTSLPTTPPPARLRPGLLLSLRLCLFPGRPGLAGFFLLEQSQGIRSVEGVLADRFLRCLAGVTQSDVHAAIAGEDDRSHILEHPPPIFCAQLGVPFNRILHLGVGEVLLFTERLSLDVSGGNTEFDQEALGAVDTPFRKRLIVFHRTTRIGVALKSQACVWLALEIDLEVTSECPKSFLLARKQAAVGALERRLGGRKIDTVKRKPLLNGDNFRGWGWRWRWGLYVQRR
jgi:hypothetical protein